MSVTLVNPGTRAILKSYRMSASKVREVLDLIRGKDIITARDILIYSERGAAKVILKLLASAVANAENNDSIPADELFVSACFADEGPTLKRFKPRARGRASQILKRTSHITIYVARMDSSRISEISRKRSAEATKRAERRSVRVKRSTGQGLSGEEVSPEVEIIDVVEAPTPDTGLIEAEVVQEEVSVPEALAQDDSQEAQESVNAEALDADESENK